MVEGGGVEDAGIRVLNCRKVDRGSVGGASRGGISSEV